jgi:hypothetical protein
MTPLPVPAPADVGLHHLGGLTATGLAAFAARTARRALGFATLPDDGPAAATRLALVAGVRAAEDRAAGRTLDDPAGVTADAYAAAEAASGSAGFLVYAAAHAARAAWFAGRVTAVDDPAFGEAIASAFGTLRALLNNADPAGGVVGAAVRADFDALDRLALGPPGSPGSPVDASDAGPLGPLWPV